MYEHEGTMPYVGAATEGKALTTTSKPRVFIPCSEQAINDQARLSRIIGVIYPGHGEPTVGEMTQSLRSISASFAVFDWKFVKWGNQHLLRFSTTEGLYHIVRRTSIPCRAMRIFLRCDFPLWHGYSFMASLCSIGIQRTSTNWSSNMVT